MQKTEKQGTFQKFGCLLVMAILILCGQCVRGKAPSGTLQMLFPLQQTGLNNSPPSVTFATESNLYVSAQPGARNTAQLTWNASDSGSYAVRLSTDCATGPVLASGNYSNPGEDLTIDFPAASYSPGVTPVCVRVTNARGIYGEKQAFVIRDDDAPTVTVTPGTGVYGKVPKILVSCTDPGGSGCGRTAMRIGADPAMDLNGVTAGVEYTAPISPPDSATTAYRFKIMDRAGNQSVVTTASYIVDSVLPVITLNSISPSSFAVSNGAVSFSYKTNVKGTAALYVGGTDCEPSTSGTLVATATISTINPTSTRSIGITAPNVAANLVPGPNDIRLCVSNTAGLVSYTTQTITRDNAAPTISSSSAPTGTVDPNSMTFLFNFSEPMSPTGCPVNLTIQGSNVGCPGISTWITSQSLEVKMFPVENMEIAWSVTGVRDLANNAVASLPSGNFRTAMQAKRRFPVTETQQALCYDSLGSLTSCAGTGQNGLNPSGPTPMVLSAPYAPNASYPLDAVVDDSRTGLMWMVCPTTQSWSGVSCSGTITIQTWQATVDVDVNSGNSRNANAGYAGFRDWRLPTAAELSTIKIYDTTASALPPAFFPGAAARFYWTSTGTGSTSVYNMALFGNGNGGRDTDLYTPTGANGVSLLVRDPNPGSIPATFTDNLDGTLWDPLNQLSWEKCSAGQSASDCSDPNAPLNFADAVAHCGNLGLAGRIWRLPTIKELKSITDYGATSAPFVFPAFAGSSGAYWTSTVSGGSIPFTKQLLVGTWDGTGYTANRTGEKNSVRCVSGP